MKFYFFLFLFYFIVLLQARSDQFGHNPHHELGGVWEDTSLSLFPYWRLAGDARIFEDRVRLVPDRQSKVGSIWNTIPNSFENWEALMKIQISGVSSIGADGMAFWYVDSPDPGKRDFFGYQEKFNGLGIIIDTYDNDNTGNHPMLVGVLNNGEREFTHSHDGHNDDDDMEIGNCHFPLRNKPPVSVRVRYYDKILTVDIMISGEWTNCFTSNRIFLPKNYFFGFSANTGDLADNHDVLGFAIKNLDPNAATIDSQSTFAHPLSLHQINAYLGKIEKSLYDTLLPSVQSKPELLTHTLSRPINSAGQCDTSRLSNSVEGLRTRLMEVEAAIGDLGQIGGSSVSRQDKRALDNLQASFNKLRTSITALNREFRTNPGESSGYFWTIFMVIILSIFVALVYYTRTNKTEKAHMI